MSTLYDPDNRLAPRPPMGWNSYNAFGAMHGVPADTNLALPGGVALEERVILETADALVASGLRDAGYVYLNIDDRWQEPREPRGSDGRLQPDLRRFPRGMAPIGAYLHERGLKFGLYAVANVFACGGEEGDGPNGLPSTGSLGHEHLDARTFAEWGVDFLKIDWCGVDAACNRGRAAEVFETWNHAIKAAGRDIVLSASTWGEEDEHLWAPQLSHMWRTTEDLHATWESIQAVAHTNAITKWSQACGPSKGWNDPDMMHVGHPALSLAEARTHLALWAMMSAPLLAGHDVRTMSDNIRSMLLCPEIIAIDQDPSPPATVEAATDSWDVWRRPLDDGRVAHAIINLNYEPRVPPKALVFDGREVLIGVKFPSAKPQQIPAHGVRLTIS